MFHLSHKLTDLFNLVDILTSGDSNQILGLLREGDGARLLDL